MKKKALPKKHRTRVAIVFIMFALISSFALPYSGLLDMALQRLRPCTIYEQIQAANLDEAVGNCPAGYRADVIELNEDITLWARLPSIKSDITIQSNGHAITGDGKVGMFSVLAGGKLKIENARLIKGAGSQFEGAIQIDGGEVHLVDVTVSDSADDRGSAIMVQTGRLYIRDSKLEGRPDIRSHAITNEDGTVSIVNSTIEGFHFDFPGGAIINHGNMTIAQSAILNNSAMSGAAIYSLGTLEISDSTFAHNSAGLGGAIHSLRTELRIVDSEFTANRADRQGGAIFSRDTVTRISHSDFNSNSAAKGGAIGGMDSWLTVSNSTIKNNSAVEKGGGLNIQNGSLRMESGIILDNAAEDGGGINSDNATLTFSESEIKRNRADIGGGFYITGGTLTLHDSVIQSNCASNSFAAIYHDDKAKLTEAGSIFADNNKGDCSD